MKRKLVMCVVVVMALAMCACTEKDTTSSGSSGVESSTTKEKEENTNKEKTSELAYDFAVDSANNKVSNLFRIVRTGMYEVYYKNSCKYIIDSEGNTVLRRDSEVEEEFYGISNDNKYIYDPGEEISVYSIETNQNVTPEGLEKGESGKFMFIKNDLLVTQKGTYDLKANKALWNDKELDMYIAMFRNDSLCIGYSLDDKMKLYNYLTGEDLLEKTRMSLPEDDKDIYFLQINGNDQYSIETSKFIMVFDNAGNKLSQFPIPDGYHLSSYSFPGEFVVAKKDKNLLIMDINGNVVKDDVKLDELELRDPFTLDIGDHYFIVDGGEYGILDSHMNWVVPQSEGTYSYIERLYGDIFLLKEDKETKYIYDARNDKKITATGMKYIFTVCPTAGNKLFYADNKLYNLEKMELVAIDYKEEFTYSQVSETSFIEYQKDSLEPITVYDADGKVLKTIELQEGDKYVDASGNSVAIYRKDKGIELITY